MDAGEKPSLAAAESSRRQQDSQWLATLSETELDLLISLKELAAMRAKNAGHPRLADKFDLRTLRALGIVLLESFKERLKETSVANYTKIIDRHVMEASRLVILLALAMAAAMVHPSQAQNSPQDFVNLHNAARAAVGVGPVTWDTSVQAFAESYAKQRAGDCKLIHSSNRPNLGENLFMGPAGRDWTAADAVNLWVDEKKYYNYVANSCTAPQGRSCGHYTQVVWRKSTSIGCARVSCNGNAGVFITCNYKPPGNYKGERPY